MKILHITTRALRGGGAERNLRHMIARQVDTGHTVGVAVGYEERTTAAFFDRCAVHRVSPLRRAINPIHDLCALIVLTRLIRREQYDVVHTHESKAGVLGRIAGALNGAVVVHTVHMPSFGETYGPGSFFFRTIERACARITQRIVTVGSQLRDFYIDGNVGTPEQYTVIRSPVDVAGFSNVRAVKPEERREIRCGLGLNPDAATLVSIGALEKRKRHSLLIDVVDRMNIGEPIQLVVVGEGREEPDLRKRARSLPAGKSVHFLGYVDDPRAVLACADLLVHTSSVEGVPQVVIQALAAGLPVVVTDAVGAREIRDRAVVVANRDGHDLALCIQHVLHDRVRPIDLEALSPWSVAEVEEAQHRLNADLRQLCQEKRSGFTSTPVARCG